MDAAIPVARSLRVALVHDWLVTYAGAERVLEQLVHLLPHADLFAVVDFLGDDQRAFIQGKRARTTFIQRLPGAHRRYRSYLPLMPLAIEQLDLSKYDLIISNSYAVAKGVITGPDQLHIAYIQSPIRYAWDLTHQYLDQSGLAAGPRSWLARIILHYIRLWDYRTGSGPDRLYGNSGYIARRIRKVYGRRDVGVLYPPVDIEAFDLHTSKEEFYLTASRMVPYKRIDLLVDAFAEMPQRTLAVIGDGPEFDRVRSRATPNVKLLGYQPHAVLKEYMQRARAFLFAAEEDFGIVPIEAMACGTPVIAFGRGGIRETVVPGQTGLFFDEQSADSVRAAVEKFEQIRVFDPETCRRQAERFSVPRFRSEMRQIVEDGLADHGFIRRTNIPNRLELLRAAEIAPEFEESFR